MPFATVRRTVQAKNFRKIGIPTCAPSWFPKPAENETIPIGGLEAAGSRSGLTTSHARTLLGKRYSATASLTV
jgi:hypothetical protein